MDEPDHLLQSHLDLVYGTCLRVLGNAQDAADATQEVAMHWLRARGTIRTSTAAWLHAAAHSKAVDMVRRREAMRRAVNRSGGTAVVEEAETAGELRLHLDAALADLPVDERTLLLEHHLEGLNLEVLAERRGTSRMTLSRRLAQARDLLAAALSRRGISVGAAALAGLLANEAHAATCPAAIVAQLPAMAGSTAPASAAVAGWKAITLGLAAAVTTTTAIAVWPHPAALSPPNIPPAPAVAVPAATAANSAASGLASRYPGDAGIDGDPAVIFHDGFEGGDFSHWDDRDGNPAPENRIVDDPALVHHGRKAAQLQQLPGGQLADLVKWLDRGYDRVYARWYYRFASDFDPGAWSADRDNGGSLVAARDRDLLGAKEHPPDGSDYFASQIWADAGYNDPVPGLLRLRSQHPGMRPAEAGNPWWGEVDSPSTPVPFSNGRWYSCELFMAANTPGRHDGEMSCWLDGNLRFHREGMHWRDHADLRINAFWLPFSLGGCQRPVSIAIDDVVLATTYIGPMAASPPHP